MVCEQGNSVEMGSWWSKGVIGEEIVGVSLGVVGHGWVKAGVVDRCLVMCGVVGHFVEVAVVVECWEEEEGEVRVD